MRTAEYLLYCFLIRNFNKFFTVVNCAEYYLQIEDFSIDQILEHQI